MAHSKTPALPVGRPHIRASVTRAKPLPAHEILFGRGIDPRKRGAGGTKSCGSKSSKQLRFRFTLSRTSAAEFWTERTKAGFRPTSHGGQNTGHAARLAQPDGWVPLLALSRDAFSGQLGKHLVPLRLLFGKLRMLAPPPTIGCGRPDLPRNQGSDRSRDQRARRRLAWRVRCSGATTRTATEAW
jgi:hypothetical protein